MLRNVPLFSLIRKVILYVPQSPMDILEKKKGNIGSVFIHQILQWEISDFSVLQKYLLVAKVCEDKAALILKISWWRCKDSHLLSCFH